MPSHLNKKKFNTFKTSPPYELGKLNIFTVTISTLPREAENLVKRYNEKNISIRSLICHIGFLNHLSSFIKRVSDKKIFFKFNLLYRENFKTYNKTIIHKEFEKT